MTYWKAVGSACGVLVGIATVLQTVGTFGVSWDELQDAAWPDGTVAILLAAVAVLTVGLLLERRRAQMGSLAGIAAEPVLRPSEADQRRLNALLSMLSRTSIRQIERTDFHSSWRAITINPVRIYVQELTDIEHHFGGSEGDRR